MMTKKKSTVLYVFCSKFVEFTGLYAIVLSEESRKAVFRDYIRIKE